MMAESYERSHKSEREAFRMPNYLKLPTTTKGLIRVVIEIPRGATAKLVFDTEAQVFCYARLWRLA
jgi:inorganic pyrophosphatase